LYIENGTSQGVYYNIQGNKNNRTLIFEYYTTDGNYRTQNYQFQILFFEDKPNIVQFIYLNISDEAKYATVGIQSKQIFHPLYHSFII
jgi:hypothetical protein